LNHSEEIPRPAAPRAAGYQAPAACRM